MHPLLIFAVGMTCVLGMILLLRLHAFVALITAAVVVSLLAPGDLSEKMPRVGHAFGTSVSNIGIPIAMAALVGSCLLASGAADRIVRAMLSVMGEQRGSLALASSGFVLSIPVFFDTVFFLLVPLARSLFQRTGKHYLRYLLAIGAGGAIAHTLIPPTPGPLLVADQLGVEVGLMMIVGILIGLPSVGVGLILAAWLDRRIQLENPPLRVDPTAGPPGDFAASSGPGLVTSLLPVLVPIGLVASQTIFARLASGSQAGPVLKAMALATGLVGNPSFALMVAAAIALLTYVITKRPTPEDRAALVEKALLDAGMIILVTAAGGAFGAMLKVAQIGPAIQFAFDGSGTSGLPLLGLGFGIASLLKISQGSSTVAMMTAGGMLAAMIQGRPLSFHPVYLAQAIGCGALFGVWMNDSGFWLFCRMGGLTETEGLKTWTVILAVIAVTAMLVTVAAASLLPMIDT